MHLSHSSKPNKNRPPPIRTNSSSTIQRDQILRSHLRRAKRGGDNAPDGYYGGCGDGGYESGAASSSSSDGGGGAGGFGDGEHSVIGGGSASCCSGTPAPRSAGEGAGP